MTNYNGSWELDWRCRRWHYKRWQSVLTSSNLPQHSAWDCWGKLSVFPCNSQLKQEFRWGYSLNNWPVSLHSVAESEGSGKFLTLKYYENTIELKRQREFEDYVKNGSWTHSSVSLQSHILTSMSPLCLGVEWIHLNRDLGSFQ